VIFANSECSGFRRKFFSGRATTLGDFFREMGQSLEPKTLGNAPQIIDVRELRMTRSIVT
jgi:hypothetical protein